MTEQNKYSNEKFVSNDIPIQGFKYLNNCTVQSYTDLLLGRWKIYDTCYARITINPGSHIYEPVTGRQLSTDSYFLDEIRTVGGSLCTSAYTPIVNRKSIKQIPKTNYKSKLDKNPSSTFSEGLYFYPDKDLCEMEAELTNNYTEYSLWGFDKKRHFITNMKNLQIS